MTSMQLKHGFGRTASGNLNKKQQQGKFKQIQLGDSDVQMFSPQFLQTKTLKKPLRDYGLIFTQSGQNFVKPQNDKTKKNPISKNMNLQPSKSIEDLDTNLNKTQKLDYTFISFDSSSKIKPAYKPVEQDATLKLKGELTNFSLDIEDKNTIFSAIMKKGSKPKKSITFADQIVKESDKQGSETEKKVGKAQNKLKQLFNKNVSKPSNFGPIEIKKTENKKANISEDIDEEIHQSIGQYGQQDFQNYSGQSGAIKQSIRQQLAASSGSGFIKQSIRQSLGNSSNGKHRKSEIMEQIQQSIRASKSASKDQIPEFISSYKSSKNNIKEQIHEQLSGSRKSGSQVYQQIFQEYDDSLRNSRNAFKKSNNFKDKDNDILSKSFRKKTNVVKSIKLAEQINLQQSQFGQVQGNKKSSQTGDNYAEQFTKEKKELMKTKLNLNQLISNKNSAYQIPDKNKNLIYEFKIEINKLLTSQNFQSKLKKLTNFINFENQSTLEKNMLEDKILQNIFDQINKIKKPELGTDQIQQLRSQYEDKLKTMLKDQQINLRVQMDKKLHEKDMQLKKMIAELQQKFEGKAFTASAKINNLLGYQQNNQFSNSGLFQVESDYSIDSDNVSWKADLWEVLPDYEKKKLYDRQTKEVTNFLTEIMMNELKEQSLSRGDLDISFEFPEQFNNSRDKLQQSSDFPQLKKNKRIQQIEDSMPKAAFNRKQFEQNVSLNHAPKKQSIFPDFPKPKQMISAPIIDLNKKQPVNQYSKVEGQQAFQRTKKIKQQKQKILQILSKYKNSYLRKKNDAIRKILKTIKPKDSKKVMQQNILSQIQEISILAKQEVDPTDFMFVKAYEEELVWTLVSIITKNENKKTSLIEDQMRKNYDRLVVLCQAKTAQNAQEVVCLDVYQNDKDLTKVAGNINAMTMKRGPLQIAPKQEAVEFIQKKEEKNVKNELVNDILNILMVEFSKDFPKRKK